MKKELYVERKSEREKVTGSERKRERVRVRERKRENERVSRLI